MSLTKTLYPLLSTGSTQEVVPKGLENCRQGCKASTQTSNYEHCIFNISLKQSFSILIILSAGVVHDGPLNVIFLFLYYDDFKY